MKTLVSGLIAFGTLFSSTAAVNQVISSGRTNPPPARSAAPSSLAFLSQDQMVLGLKEALSKGVQQAVFELGHDGGFLTNLHVRIPPPPQLQTVEKTLRSLGQDKLADDFVAAMNHAAEQAVPAATAVFVEAVQHMTINDASAILTGPNDAATQYFRRITETNLHQRFLPIVKTATDKAGVTSLYKRLLGAMNENQYLGALESILTHNQTVDLDAYITGRALDGLFIMVAQEEARIRKDPIARSSQLLQRVFGAVYGRSG